MRSDMACQAIGRRGRASVASVDVIDDTNDMIRGPKWRTRTTPERRRAAAVATFALIVVIGGLLLGGAMWLLDRAGSPTWFTLLPWLVPTAVVLVWTVTRPQAAIPTDSDEDTWPGYAIRFGLFGDGEPRPLAARLVIGVLFGAPVAWSILVIGTAAILGLAG